MWDDGYLADTERYFATTFSYLMQGKQDFLMIYCTSAMLLYWTIYRYHNTVDLGTWMLSELESTTDHQGCRKVAMVGRV